MRRLKKRYWLPPLIILALVALFAIALDPIVEWQTRKRLAQVFEPRYTATFEDASVNLFKLKYVLKKLDVKRHSAGGDKLPYISAERTEAGIYGKELLHGHLVLERSHYDAVTRAQLGDQQQSKRPMLKSQRQKATA